MENHREMINKCVGVVAEFDPFHAGHAHLLGAIREKWPEKGIICAMSGWYTQRGSAACADPYVRAEMAVAGGADLVLELPTLWSSASAETFARGGIGLLLDTGVVDAIAFGSEDGDLERLAPTAQALDEAALTKSIQAGLAEGLSYAAARQRAAEAATQGAAACLAGANNTLGVEYLRALHYWGRPEVEAFTIPRKGAGHNSAEEIQGFASASRIRRALAAGEWESIADCLPEASLRLLRQEAKEKRCPALLQRCETAVLARLRTMTAQELSAIPDCGGGLEQRILRVSREAVSLEDFYDRAKTRRYPEARIRRIALWAFLGLKASDRPERVPCISVLACSERGQELLHSMKKTAALPVLTRPGQLRTLNEEAGRVMALEQRCAALWPLCLPAGADRSAEASGLRGMRRPQER